MPKRTLSDASSSAYADSSDDTSAQEDLTAHVPKFSRLSESPSLPADMATPSPSSDVLPATSNQSIQCLLPPHAPLTFASVSAFEAHLYSHHTNRCVDCRANFPTSHLLDLHQAEHHDPLVATRREKGEKTFACLVPGCEKVCVDKRKRRMHVVDKHGFRKDYDWEIVEMGIDGRSSVLKGYGGAGQQRSRKQSLTGGVSERGVKKTAGFQKRSVGTDASEKTANAGNTATSLEEENLPEKNLEVQTPADSPKRLDSQEPGIDNLTKSMSALRFVPPSVSRKKAALATQST